MDGLAELSTAGVRGDLAAARAAERARLLSPVGRRRWLRIAGLGVLAGGLAAAVLLSLAVGARPIPLGVVIEALTAFDAADTGHLVVHDLRLPRTMVGIAVGLALSVAGALMQAITRNPLADPGLLGVNSGASLAAVIAIWVLHVTSFGALVWFALAGAGSIAVLVYMLGSLGRGGATPVRLALAGAAINALLFALVSAVLLLSKETLDVYRFWIVGSLTGAAGIALRDLLPFLAAGMALAIVAGRALNAVALGDDTARALGTRLGLTRVIAMMAITLLCGTAGITPRPIGEVLETTMTPLIGRVKLETRLAEPAQWRLVADGLAAAFLHAGTALACPDRAQAAAMAAVRDPRFKPFNGHTGFHRLSETEVFLKRGGCCRYYTCEAGSYCATCILRSPEDQLLQLQRQIDAVRS